MALLSHRTTLLLSDEEYCLLVQESKATKKTMGELIRRAIGRVYRKSTAGKKKKAWARLFKANAPVVDWETMEQEILKGRLS